MALQLYVNCKILNTIRAISRLSADWTLLMIGEPTSVAYFGFPVRHVSKDIGLTH